MHMGNSISMTLLEEFVFWVTAPLWIPLGLLLLLILTPFNKESRDIFKEIWGDIISIRKKRQEYKIIQQILKERFPNDYFKKGTLYVKGGISGKQYSIRSNSVHIKDWCWFCVLMKEASHFTNHPKSDYYVMMAFLIKNHEEYFLKNANPTGFEYPDSYAINNWRQNIVLSRKNSE
jgi:hypothetical protein